MNEHLLSKSNILQQKVSVLISDWLPAINKSTDAQKLTSASRNKNTRSIFLFL